MVRHHGIGADHALDALVVALAFEARGERAACGERHSEEEQGAEHDAIL